MKGKSAANIKMTSFEDLFKGADDVPDADGEKVREIAINELYPFQNHPFRVSDDEKMQDMVESIEEYGILNPLLVRPRAAGGYELISGHRRKHACEKAGVDKVPCIVRELGDEEAVILMVDSNIQREELLFSEKAFAYKMKLEIMKRKAGRPNADNDKNGSQLGNNFEKGVKSIEVMASELNESKNQIHRYIRLTELLPVLLDKVDSKQMPFGAGVEISYLDTGEQEMLLKVMDRLAVVPNLAQAAKLKELSRDRKLDETGMELILSREKPVPSTFRLERKKLDGYFPKGYTEEQKEQVIYELLQEWSYKNNVG